MSNPHLPPEVLDYVVDLLLFGHVGFYIIYNAQLWGVFPDPTNSPERYAKTLYTGSHVVGYRCGSGRLDKRLFSRRVPDDGQ